MIAPRQDSVMMARQEAHRLYAVSSSRLRHFLRVGTCRQGGGIEREAFQLSDKNVTKSVYFL